MSEAARKSVTGALEAGFETKLAAIRATIDRLDAEMHARLIERGSAIGALIRVKGTSRPGAAFRPGREADMMRRLVARHEGALKWIFVLGAACASLTWFALLAWAGRRLQGLFARPRAWRLLDGLTGAMMLLLAWWVWQGT